MRITHGDLYATMLRNLDDVRGRIRVNQEKLSSGKNLTQPSTDPATAAKILLLTTEIQEINQFSKNATQAVALLDHTLIETGRIQDLLGEAVLTAATAGSRIGTDRTEILEAKFESILNELVATVNANFGERYLFSGYQTRTAPFTSTVGATPSGKQGITAVAYGGGAQRTSYTLSDELTAEVAIPGTALSDSGGADIFATLRAMRDAVAAGDNAALDAAELDAARHQKNLIQVEADLGLALSRGRNAVLQGEANKFNAFERLGSREDADIAEVLIGLEEQRQLLDASLRAIISLEAESLFDRL